MHLAVAATDTNPLSLLLNYGPVGIMLMLIAVGYIVPKPTHVAVVKERDELKAENQTLNTALIARNNDLVPRADLVAAREELAKYQAKMQNEILPGLFTTTSILERALTAMNRLAERAPV